MTNSLAGALPALRGPTVDVSSETRRRVVIAQGTPELYQGHADTVLLPDGKTLFAISEDEGQTWSRPRRLSAELTGDRHCPIDAPDGRLVVLMRDMLLNGSSPTEGHFVAWVGTWDDIVAGRSGQYRVKRLHSHAEPNVRDCGYPSFCLSKYRLSKYRLDLIVRRSV